MQTTFTNIYENNVWGNNNNPSYRGSSGGGSDIDYNKDTYVPFIRNFINENNVKSVVDLGCGDFRCGPLIYETLDITYTGYDVYKGVIEFNSTQHLKPKYNFIHLDFCNNKTDIVDADLCIIKDVIQHWPLDDIYKFLDYIVENKKFKYILITNCCNQNIDNTDIRMGDWRALSSKHYPLKKYDAKSVYHYSSKEVSLINCS